MTSHPAAIAAAAACGAASALRTLRGDVPVPAGRRKAVEDVAKTSGRSKHWGSQETFGDG